MSVSSAFVVHAVVAPGFTLTQIESARPTVGSEILSGYAAGFHHPLFRTIASQKPAFEVQTSQLATLLAAVPLVGLDQSAGNTDLEIRKATQYGTRTAIASLVHERLRLADCFAYWSRINARHREIATADLMLVAGYDGTNEPIVPAGSVAATATSTAAEYFTCGPVSLNGSDVGGVQEVTIESGLQLLRLGGEGDVWDTFICVQQSDPVVTIRALRADALRVFALVGTELTAANFYLRRKTDNGGNVANATTSHIKLAATSGLITIDDERAGNNNPFEATIRCTLQAPSLAVEPLTISTGVAII